ncbi:MAG TPA: tRNA (adenosine(37)-N6)-dimethylallyltransferase MiaA [bacterium]|nr:tRNA (adenosine(37)-N6)-dimethylallyltransferase MiaA [bacterium]
MDKAKLAIAIIGPTAAGKTKLAISLADLFNGEIVSADSRQVYRGMDIGTGKDLADYQNNGRPIAYHLIDVIDPSEVFDLANYKKLANIALDDIASRGKLPIVAGGSGLYLQALIDNYKLADVKPDLEFRQKYESLTAAELYRELNNKNPKLAQKLNNSDKNNPRRLLRYLEIATKPIVANTKKDKSTNNFNWLILGLDYPMEVLEKRIYIRIMKRLEQEDMVAEVSKLHDNGLSWKRLESFGLEYRYISYYLQEKLDYDQMIEQLHIASRQFAKRQKTWFRRWEKQGRKIYWLNPESALPEASQIIKELA